MSRIHRILALGLSHRGFRIEPTLNQNLSAFTFKFRRGRYFWHTRAAIGHATALAVARRTRVAEHTLRRNRAGLPP